MRERNKERKDKVIRKGGGKNKFNRIQIIYLKSLLFLLQTLLANNTMKDLPNSFTMALLCREASYRSSEGGGGHLHPP